MQTNVIDLLKKRRSVYNIGKKVEISDEDIATLVKEAVKESPTSFNSQTSRAVILFGDAHLKLWEITENKLRNEVPDEEAFKATQAKLDSFRAGYGTVLFFEDQDVVRGLQEQFALYAENFPIWSEQSSGIASMSVWAAFTDNNIGASLQHYNPLIDADVQKEWDLPESWKLRGQMPFGSIEAVAGEKEYMDDEERFRVFK
ncbi:nitroreductase family protein [Jeotgalibaca ciconiae]|uniref:Nitroreductase family protein n=1 Tax=Jeotgalibaca ciconiae TaxID=2496265 RepID=A0A3S9HA37_9LACT|nr:nitroreductase family protein [Jeotgalibaca ciconiae]AZP04218.1 nitroreductase family protein [Jeotgalibaca ciconiae]HJB24840.1 nitroreductase family protein [Candidatus Jeotgalibaca pullicola]